MLSFRKNKNEAASPEPAANASSPKKLAKIKISGLKAVLFNYKKLMVRLWFAMQMAFHGIITNPLRSALTVLGVAIGVASVVSLMSIGEGARQSVMQQFESLGTNVILIEAEEKADYFDPGFAEELTQRVDNIELATPIVKGEDDVKWRRMKGKIDILGVNEDFPQIRDHELVAGRFFTSLHVEQRSPVVVLGFTLAQKLLNGRSPVGQTISIGGIDYTILGVLAEKGAGNGDNIDNMIVMPYTSAQRITHDRKVSQIWCKATDTDSVDLAVVQLSRIFRQQLDDDSFPVSDQTGGAAPEDGSGATGEGDGGAVDGGAVDSGGGKPVDTGDTGESEATDDAAASGGDFSEDQPITITNLNQMVDEADNANRVMTLLLGAIAAISLLVGGLGIMNIMLVAVTERIEEIGVRRAIGARRGDLSVQFLLEALYLSGCGALVGVIVGLSLLNVFDAYGLTAIVSFVAIRVAVLVALGCGLVFGVYPAVSASAVAPVEALRRN